jgi:hypothetical protein
MTNRVRCLALAACAGLCLFVAACGGGSPAASPSPSATPPLTDMRLIATEHHATEAWWTLTTLSRAFKLQGRGFAPAPSPGTPVYVLVMRGDFGTVNGQREAWATSIVGIPNREDLSLNTHPFDLNGLALHSLPLPSP